MLVEASHRSGDRLERLVDGGDVAEQDDEGADRDVAAEDGGEAEAEDERRSKRRRGLDAEGEPRLADGQLDPLVDGGLALVSEPLELVRLAPERDDHPQHAHRLVHDRERLPLEPLDDLETGHDLRPVETERVVDERDCAEGDERDLPVDQKGDHRHADDSQEVLGEDRERHGDRADGGGLVVDPAHELASPAGVVERQRQPLGVLEEVAPEVEHHALLEPGVDEAVDDRQRLRGDGEEEAERHHRREDRVLVREAEEEERGGRLVPRDVVEHQRERPGDGESRHRREHRQEEREAGALAVGADVGKDARNGLPELPPTRLRLRCLGLPAGAVATRRSAGMRLRSAERNSAHPFPSSRT